MKKFFIILFILLSVSSYGQVILNARSNYVQASSGSSPSSLLTGILGYWKMDEASGNLVDAHAAYDLTVAGNPSYGGSGVGLTFDGTGDWASIPIYGNTALAPIKCSVSAWFHLTTNDFLGVAGAYYIDENPGGWWIATENTKMRATVYDNLGSGAEVTSTTTINTGGWFLVVITMDGVHLKMYINGSQEGGDQDAAFNLSYNYWDGAGWFAIGCKFPNDTPMIGTIKEVGYWSRDLTSTEVTTLYNSGSVLTYPF